MDLITKKRGLDSMLNQIVGGDFFMNQQGMYSGKKSMPAVNISEEKDSYHIKLAAPGLKKSNFSIEFDNGLLTIASKVEESTESDARQIINEFNYGSFKRSFSIPKQKVDEAAIDAQYEAGILSIKLPKREEAKVKAKRIIGIN